MLNAPAPDMDRLISGGRARRRRRTLARTGIAAVLVAVLVGGGAYGVMQIDSGTAVEPAQPPSTTTTPETFQDLDGDPLEPGTYRVAVGADASGVAIGADLTFDDEAWNANDFPVLLKEGRYGGVAVYQPAALAAGDGCSNENPNRDVADSPQALAEQLALLPQSTVAQPPAPAQAFGRDAVHLRLRIDHDCGTSRYYRVAESELGAQHGICVQLLHEGGHHRLLGRRGRRAPGRGRRVARGGRHDRAAGRDRARSRLDHLHALTRCRRGGLEPCELSGLPGPRPARRVPRPPAGPPR